MSKRVTYLDYMATTPVDPRVAEKMSHFLTSDGVFGNPSSGHEYGMQAAEAVKVARKQVADLINAEPNEIVFTSGATESDNLAIKGAAYFYRRSGKHIITAKTEHKAVLDCCRALESEGYEVTYLKPQVNGLIALQDISDAIRDDTILVSIMHVNNEVGVIQDIAAIGTALREKGILFHVDAAQAAGKIPIDLKSLPVDLMSFSAHKLYGPKGIGALYVNRKPRVRLQAAIHGGGQEQGLRSGTLATHQIVGMGEAFALAKEEMQQESKRILNLRNRFLAGLETMSNIHINGDLQHRVPGNLNVSFANVEGESLLLALRDIAVSNSSACSTASVEPSYVLTALGISNELAHNAIRFSFGRFTTEDEIDHAIDLVKHQVARLRNISSQ